MIPFNSDSHQQDERFATLLRQSTAGFVQADATGRITLVNQTWCDMLGYSEAEIVGKYIQEVTHPDDLAATLAAVGQMASGGPNFAIEKRYLRRDGSCIWAVSSVTALRSQNGDYEGLGAIVLDMSQRRETEEQLRQAALELAEADRCKTEFLATLAHELRNPLAPLSNALQMMRLAGDQPDLRCKAQAIMERQLRAMVDLVDDLLDIARISRGKIVLKKKAVEVSSLVASAVETSAAMMNAGQHELSVDLPAESLWLHGDPTRLVQVLSNILNNAAKYTPPGGHICVSAHRSDDDVVLAVQDDGVGIASDAMPHIFEMFTQVGRNLDKAQGGLGVGLGLAKSLVELHDGTLSAQSEGAGRGSRFTMTLGLADDTPATPHPPLHAAPEIVASQPGALRILVVDDNPDGADTLAAVLDMQGHICRTANDGYEALATAERFQPQLVFLDIGMPGLNGYEVAERMRRIPGLAHAVLVALTGWGSDEDRERASKAGFDLHLTKPADMESIERLLASVAGRYEFAPSA
ncbi:MAG: ATP-binding protein [Pseudomonadota bacterium]